MIFLIFKRRELEKQKEEKKRQEELRRRSNSLKEIEIDHISTTQSSFFLTNKKVKIKVLNK